MFFTPATVLRIWICGLLSVALLVLGGYLVNRWYDALPRETAVVVHRGSETTREVRVLSTTERITSWRPGFDGATAALAGGFALIAWTFLGSLFSPKTFRPVGTNEPKAERIGKTRRIRRPDGTDLQLEIYGRPDAPTIIFTHGWGCDSTVWYYVKQQLSQQFRVVVWDLPGLGRSTQPNNRDFSLEKMAHDLRAVLKDTGDEPTILVGHSIGGMIMLTFCRLFPETLGRQVTGLAITNSTYTNPLKTMALARLCTTLQKPVIVPLLHLTIWLSPLVWLMNWLSYLNGSAHWSTSRESFAGTETRGQLDFATRFTVKASPAVVARGTLAMLDYDASNTLAGIEVPTLVFVGDRDPVTKPEAGRHIDDVVPHSRLFELSPAKHLAFFERSEEFFEVSQQFLEFASVRQIPEQPAHAEFAAAKK